MTDKVNKKVKDEENELSERSSNSSDYEFDNQSDDKRARRLMRNKKSALKCRMKKKAEFVIMKEERDQFKEETTVTKAKLHEVTVMLYKKIEENQFLTNKIDRYQSENIKFLTQLLLNWHQNG